MFLLTCCHSVACSWLTTRRLSKSPQIGPRSTGANAFNHPKIFIDIFWPAGITQNRGQELIAGCAFYSNEQLNLVRVFSPILYFLKKSYAGFEYGEELGLARRW